MREIRLIFGKEYSSLDVGVAGENLATRIFVQCKNVLDRHPGAIFSVHIQRADELLYIADAGIVPDEYGVIRYDLKDADVSVPGLMRMEVWGTENDVKVITSVYRFNVRTGLYDSTPTPPEPGWIDQVAQNAADAKTAQLGAEAAKDMAKGYADAAHEAMTKYPTTGEDDNWLTWNPETGEYVDTGVSAKGIPGEAATITIAETKTVSHGTPAAFEELPGSTAQARKYRAAVPIGQPGADGEAATIEIVETRTGAEGTKAIIEDAEGSTASARKLIVTIPVGVRGKDGTGVNILGSYDTYEDLAEAQPVGAPGDAYLVQGDLYVWSANTQAWVNVGSIQGPVGKDGIGVPQGGSNRQTLLKVGDTDYTSAWGNLVPSDVGAEPAKLQYTDVPVPTSAWTQSSDADYPHTALIPLDDVTADMVPKVVFSAADADSGLYSPVAMTVDGGVEIYAREVPGEDITVPTILCWQHNPDAPNYITSAVPNLAASRWDFVMDGNPVTITPAAGSRVWVVADRDCTLTYDGQTLALTANVPAEVTAPGGEMTLSADNSAFLRVAHNRDSMDLLHEDLTVPATATGAVAQLKGLVGGLLLDVTAKAVATQEGSGDPSPDNVRRIIGRNKVDVWRGGKNLFRAVEWIPMILNNGLPAIDTANVSVGDKTGNSVSFSTAGNYRGVMCKLPRLSSQMTLSLTVGALPSTSGTILVDYDGTAYSNSRGLALTANQRNSRTFTPTPGVDTYLCIYLTTASATAASYSDIQLEIGSTANPYAPYVGHTYPVTLPEGVELYGLAGAEDEIDWARGVITKRTYLLVLDGTESWIMSSTIAPTGERRFDANLTAHSRPARYNLVSSHYMYRAINAPGMWTSAEATYSYLQLRIMDHFETTNDLKAYIAAQYAAGTPVQVLYELATPQIITIDPITIPALPGTNTVHTDAGGGTTATGRMGAQGMWDEILALKKIIAGV